jgi:hypothetical protein
MDYSVSSTTKWIQCHHTLERLGFNIHDENGDILNLIDDRYVILNLYPCENDDKLENIKLIISFDCIELEEKALCILYPAIRVDLDIYCKITDNELRNEYNYKKANKWEYGYKFIYNMDNLHENICFLHKFDWLSINTNDLKILDIQ